MLVAEGQGFKLRVYQAREVTIHKSLNNIHDRSMLDCCMIIDQQAPFLSRYILHITHLTASATRPYGELAFGPALSKPSVTMAFIGTHHADASGSTFNEVGQSQFNIQVGTILSPSPCLAPAFSSATLISSMVQEVQANREQITALAASIDTLLMTLDAEYHAGRLLEAQTTMALQNLNEYVDQ